MIRKLLLIGVMLFALQPAQSQDYLPIINNTAWNEMVSDFAFGTNYWILQGEEQNQGSHTYTRFWAAYQAGPYPNPVTEEYFIREEPENRKVYQWINNQERLLFDFSLEVGEQTVLGNGATYTVVLKDSVASMSGRKRLRLTLESGSMLGEVWIESVGNQHHPFMVNYETYTDPVFGINCSYSDGNPVFNRGLSWNNVPINCPEPPDMVVGSHETYEVTIAPNPFSQSAVMHSEKDFSNASATLYNTLGQAVKEIRDISGSEILISREGLVNGLYYIRVNESGKAAFSGTIIIAD